MKIVNLDKKQLNDFVGSLTMSQFLQSFEWGQFQEKVVGKVWRLGVEDGGQLIVVATIIKRALPMGKKYFYCPRGPIIDFRINNNSDTQIKVINFLFGEIKKLTEREGVMFLRFEPQSEISAKGGSASGGKNLKSKIIKTIDVQPSKTLILDLSKSDEELLKQMHQKTRYNIKLAEKREVKITEAKPEQFNSCWPLMQQTSQRDKFRQHPKDYYKKMLAIDFIKLFLAEYQNKIINLAIFSFFGDMISYLHGASANQYRNVMAPYLLHWQIIKLAKEQGFKYYDFGGIDEKRWPGLTRFKQGFARFAEAPRLDSARLAARRGGKEINYPGTFDLIFNQSWYNIYQMVRKVKRTF